jgi:hypothetical protein
MRYLMEYWDEGGQMTWLAQTCPELGTPERGAQNAIVGGAKACHIHGGVVDYLFANNQMDQILPAIKAIRDAGMPAGIAAHNADVLVWADKNLDVDYYMACYYNSASRDKRAEHVSGMTEWFLDEDRDRMVEVIATLSKPAIHYKVLAAGRKGPQEAFEFCAKHLRPQDAVCVGIHLGDNSKMIEEDLRIFEECLPAVGKHAAVPLAGDKKPAKMKDSAKKAGKSSGPTSCA